MRTLVKLSAFFFTSLVTHVCLASTSGVFGPKVDPDDRSSEYRSAFIPAENRFSDDAWTHRLHYQQAFNGNLRWRAISQLRDRGDGLEYDYLRAELMWFLNPNADSIHKHALRFDIRTRKGSRQETFAINWTNEWALGAKWRARAILIGSYNFGGPSDTSSTLETRARISYKLKNGDRIGLESFNSYGEWNNMGSFDNQNHQLGPIYMGKFDRYKYIVGYLAGISDASTEHTFRFWVSTSF